MSASSFSPMLAQAFETRMVPSAKGDTPLKANINQAEAKRLYETVSRLNVQTSVEVGFAQGISTLAILQALEDKGAGHHHVMDPFQDHYDNAGLSIVESAGLKERMTFYSKFAEEVIPQLESIDFAFIDASHLFDHTLMEFLLVDKKLSMGGVIGFHDFWLPALQKIMRFILKNRNYKLLDVQAPARKTWKHRVSASLGKLSISKKLFAPEILSPWSSLGIDNMAFIQKTGGDNREQTDFIPF